MRSRRAPDDRGAHGTDGLARAAQAGAVPYACAIPIELSFLDGKKKVPPPPSVARRLADGAAQLLEAGMSEVLSLITF